MGVMTIGKPPDPIWMYRFIQLISLCKASLDLVLFQLFYGLCETSKY